MLLKHKGETTAINISNINVINLWNSCISIYFIGNNTPVRFHKDGCSEESWAKLIDLMESL